MHFTHIDDIIQSLVKVLHKERALGETYNIAAPQYITIRDSFNTIADILNAKEPGTVSPALAGLAVMMLEFIPRQVKPEKLRLLDRHRVNFFLAHHAYNTAKAEEHLGYHPAVNFRDGMKETIDWYREYGYL